MNRDKFSIYRYKRLARASALQLLILTLAMFGSFASASVTASLDGDGLLRITSDADDAIRIGCSGDTVLVADIPVGDPPVLCSAVQGLEIEAGSGNDHIYVDRWAGVDGLFPNLASPVVISDAGGVDLIDCSEAPARVILSFDLSGVEVDPFSNGGMFIFVGQLENAIGTAFDDQIIVNLSQTERTLSGGDHEVGDLLIVNGDCNGYEDSGTVLSFNGYASINYAEIESFVLTCLSIEDISWGIIKSSFQ